MSLLPPPMSSSHPLLCAVFHSNILLLLLCVCDPHSYPVSSRLCSLSVVSVVTMKVLWSLGSPGRPHSAFLELQRVEGQSAGVTFSKSM